MVEFQQLTALLEKLILPQIQDQLYNKNILMKYFQKDNRGLTFKNDKIFITARTSEHSGVAFTGSVGPIPNGTNQNQQMEIGAKYGYGSHIVYDSALQVVKGQPGSLVNITKELGDSLLQRFQRSLNRQLFGNGEAILFTVTTGASSTATHTVSTTRFLAVGQRVIVGTKSAIEGGTGTTAVVATINSKTSVTFTSAITTVTGDRAISEDVWNGSAYQEITGLQNLVSDTGSFQGIARSTNNWAKSTVNSTSAVLTEAMIIDMLSDINEFGDCDIIVTTPALRNKYASLLQAQRRQNNTVDLKGGFKWLEVFAGDKPVAMVADYDCPAGTLFFLNTNSFSLAQLNPLEYLRSGSGWIMTDVYDTNGRRLPAFQTTMKFYGNLICTQANVNGIMTNKTAS